MEQVNLSGQATEVALLINRISDGWAKLFKHLEISFEPSGLPNEYFFACPTCNKKRAITLRVNRKGETLWNCNCRAQKRFFDNHIGLIRFLFSFNQGDSYSPIEIINLVEDWALTQNALGELPEGKITFGQYNGTRWTNVPKNYLRWLVVNCDGCDLEPVVREQIRRYLNLPQLQPEPANQPIKF